MFTRLHIAAPTAPSPEFQRELERHLYQSISDADADAVYHPWDHSPAQGPGGVRKHMEVYRNKDGTPQTDEFGKPKYVYPGRVKFLQSVPSPNPEGEYGVKPWTKRQHAQWAELIGRQMPGAHHVSEAMADHALDNLPREILDHPEFNDEHARKAARAMAQSIYGKDESAQSKAFDRAEAARAARPPKPPRVPQPPKPRPPKTDRKSVV